MEVDRNSAKTNFCASEAAAAPITIPEISLMNLATVADVAVPTTTLKYQCPGVKKSIEFGAFSPPVPGGTQTMTSVEKPTAIIRLDMFWLRARRGVAQSAACRRRLEGPLPRSAVATPSK